MNKFIIIGILFAVVGIAMIVMAILKNKRCTVNATAVLVGYNTRHRSRKNGGTQYTPIYEFQVNGISVQGDGGMSSSNHGNPLNVGKEVEIRYNENNPSEFVVAKKTLANDVIIGVIFIILGVLAAVFIK